MLAKVLKPDSKGRIQLGSFAKGVSSFRAVKSGYQIILEPYAEVHLREKWLYENEKAMQHLQEGMCDVAAGRVSSLGDFTQCIKKD